MGVSGIIHRSLVGTSSLQSPYPPFRGILEVTGGEMEQTMTNGLESAVHVKCVDPQYGEKQATFVSVYPNGRVSCAGADGTALSLSYAGIRHEKIRETQIELSRAVSASQVLATLRKNGWPKHDFSIY
jgi:hypothetical protein